MDKNSKLFPSKEKEEEKEKGMKQNQFYYTLSVNLTFTKKYNKKEIY